MRSESAKWTHIFIPTNRKLFVCQLISAVGGRRWMGTRIITYLKYWLINQVHLFQTHKPWNISSTCFLPCPRTYLNRLIFWTSVKLGWKQVEISDYHQKTMKTTITFSCYLASPDEIKISPRPRHH